MNEKLYVGNLAFSTTEDNLRQLFAQAGSVTACDLVKDRNSGQSRGFAFVTMGSQAEAQKAIDMFNAYSLDDHALTVNIAKPREARRSPGDQGMPRGSGRRD
jgi:RNA recognition motif-containing protein